MTCVASGDVSNWLFSPSAGEIVAKSMRLSALPIRPAAATSPMNYTSPRT
ncbi:MAG: hypothetical protein IT537_15570 [Hyphomicrobiales bacterium]|nr:hypothetical protein [Hyphomicrobiales bacterium]